MNYRTWSKIFFVLIFVGGVCEGFSSLTTITAPWNIVANCLATVFQLVWLYSIIQYNKTKTTRTQVIMLNRIGIMMAIPLVLSPWLENPDFVYNLMHNSPLPHMRMFFIALVSTYCTLLFAWCICIFVQMYKKWHGSHAVLWMYLILEIGIDMILMNLLPDRHTMPVQVTRFAVATITGAMFYFIAYRVCANKARHEL